jgi:proline-specific peptidase
MSHRSFSRAAVLGGAVAWSVYALSACATTTPAATATPTPAANPRDGIPVLMPSPRTVVYGGYDPQAAPALRVRSGDIVEIGTVSTCGTRLLQPGLDSGTIEPAIRAIQAAARDSVIKRGPGGHVLTGPVYVEGAEPGDVLEVRIQRIDLAIPYACNSFGPRSGFIPEEFPGQSKSRIVPLDAKRMVGHFSDSLGIEIPLRPFFGSIGVAPPPAKGRINSAPPGMHAGNLDNKEMVAGTTLYIPVNVPGALLLAGDGHAAQGDGEVDITALETALRGRFQLIVRKDLKQTWPRGETPTHWIAMGADSNLTIATKIAVKEAITLLGDVYHLSREDAYMLVSTGCDVRITQLVDGTMGAHVMIPKALFTKPVAPRGATAPAREGYVRTADGAQLFYRVEGSGRDTLIAIHGGPGMDQESFRGDFGPLTAKHVVIFYDQRGGGRSTLPRDTAQLTSNVAIADLDAVRAHFGLAKATLIAHSYGPLLAASYALAHPDRVARLVLMGPVPPYRADFWDRFARNSAAHMDSTQRAQVGAANRRLMTATNGDSIRAACRDLWKVNLIPRVAEPSYVSTRIKADICSSDPQGIQFGLRTANRVIMNSYGNWDLRPALRSLTVPVLILHGQAEAIPMDMVEAWATSLPNARLVKVAGAAHMLYAEQPDRVWPEVERFLAAGR